jgi:hypothetical protein
VRCAGRRPKEATWRSAGMTSTSSARTTWGCSHETPCPSSRSAVTGGLLAAPHHERTCRRMPGRGGPPAGLRRVLDAGRGPDWSVEAGGLVALARVSRRRDARCASRAAFHRVTGRAFHSSRDDRLRQRLEQPDRGPVSAMPTLGSVHPLCGMRRPLPSGGIGRGSPEHQPNEGNNHDRVDYRDTGP